MGTWVPMILSGAGVLIALLSLLRSAQGSHTAAVQHVRTELAALHERCALLEMKMGIFWRLVEENLSTMLKRPTHLEMDSLLDKLHSHTLTLPEAYQLRDWLTQVYLEEEVEQAQQRVIAILVLGAVESLIHELSRA